MPESLPPIVYLPWYRREDYPALRAIMTDPHSLAPGYDLWLMAAENNEAVARKAGLQVVRVVIRPDEFARWCADQDRSPDASARAQFAREFGPTMR